MKKTLLTIGLILAFAGITQAAAPTYAAVDGVYEYGIDTVISSSTSYDTIIGSADSTTLVTKRTFDKGWEYILVRDAITGNGSDSVLQYVSVRCFDGSGNQIYSVNVDSCTAAAGQAILLPIGGSLFGVTYTIKYKATTGAGGQCINNRIAIWKRRPIHIEKAYR